MFPLILPVLNRDYSTPIIILTKDALEFLILKGLSWVLGGVAWFSGLSGSLGVLRTQCSMGF